MITGTRRPDSITLSDFYRDHSAKVDAAGENGEPFGDHTGVRRLKSADCLRVTDDRNVFNLSHGLQALLVFAAQGSRGLRR